MLELTKESLDFPPLLKEIGDCPERLYIKGNFRQEIFSSCLAVVGSRKITPYGKRVVKEIVAPLAAQGITIVSGFMYGVDAQAHKAALSVGGMTIAVMGCGIDLMCPQNQEPLYKDILSSGGLVISEYEANTPPSKFTFPQRNRIVAGLSQATLVVEAGRRSGTLITARLARESGREVFAVPGSIFSANSKGICQLLETGAHPACSSSCIEKFYFPEEAVSDDAEIYPPGNFDSPKYANLSEVELHILEVLQNGPVDVDQLSTQLDFSISKLISALTNLSLQGFIVEEGDKYYAR